ncbi:MAG: small class heat shock protein [Devosia sp.]|uniref:Hsp20/alpha crystallin family protein n=1 Tax=Devosia sp. TaxID=1871048 RepID=UPI00262416C8|nr:Hsp20/alpha crystallin family protein [Devosia sp.]MDB5542530.1 small class heat shock protein [Devosia sp.]
MAEFTDNGQDTMSGDAESMRTGPSLLPPTDIIERQDAFLMVLDVPGADPDTLDVSFDQGILSISAQSVSTAPEGYAPIYAEYRDGTFERKFIVSDRIDGNNIDAVLRDGVLRVTLPKQVPSPAKKISVKLN